MRYAIIFFLLASFVSHSTHLMAQCPDGSAPPCRTAIRPVVAVDSNAVAIFPFQVTGSSADAAWLSEGGMDLLGIALDGLASWRVISPRTLLPSMAPFTSHVSTSDASSIARSVGAGALVLGTVVASGPDVVVSAQLYESRATRRLASASARGQLANPAPLIDSLATSLVKQRLSRPGDRVPRPVDDYGTASPTALRAYLFAEREMRASRWQLAADSLRKVIERDSSFGLAWYQLLRTRWGGNANTGFYDNDTLIKGARRDSVRLPAWARYALRTIEAQDRGQRLKALRTADELLGGFPNHPEAVLVAADAYYHYGRSLGTPAAYLIEAFERAITLDPGVPEGYMHLADLTCEAGDSTRAWQAYQLLEIPSWRVGRQLGDQCLRVLVAIGGSQDYTPQANRFRPRCTLTYRSDLYLARGQHRKAWITLQNAAALDQSHPIIQARIILHDLIAGGREREARTADTLATGAGGVILRVWRRAARGLLDSTETRAIYTKSYLMVEDLTPYRETLLAGLRGLTVLRAGDTAQARRLLTSASEVWYPNRQTASWAVPERRFNLALARIERAAGDLESARRRLDDMAFYVGLLERAEAEELRGQIAEQRGDSEAAKRAYYNFIALWQDADPELQPRVAAARASLSRIESR